MAATVEKESSRHHRGKCAVVERLQPSGGAAQNVAGKWLPPLRKRPLMAAQRVTVQQQIRRRCEKAAHRGAVCGSPAATVTEVKAADGHTGHRDAPLTAVQCVADEQPLPLRQRPLMAAHCVAVEQ